MRRSRAFLNTILGVVIGAAACSQSPTAPPMADQGRILPALSQFKVSSRPSGDGGSDGSTSLSAVGSFVGCSALDRDSKSKDIDAKGGYLIVGPHALVVPPGALLKKTHITAQITGDQFNSIKFSPEGLQFLVPTYLFMSYRNCTKSTNGTLEVVYTSDDLLQVLQNLPSFDDLPNNTVVALVSHFSQYAVAY